VDLVASPVLLAEAQFLQLLAVDALDHNLRLVHFLLDVGFLLFLCQLFLQLQLREQLVCRLVVEDSILVGLGDIHLDGSDGGEQSPGT